MQNLPKLIRPLLVLVALVATVVAASGCGTTTADIARGRILFTQKCGVCHTLAQAGTTAPDRPQPRRRLRRGARTSGSERGTIEGIVKAQVENPRPSERQPGGLDAAPTSSTARISTTSPPTSARTPACPARRRRKSQAAPAPRSSPTTAAVAATRSPPPNSGGVTGPNLDEVLPGQTAAMIEESIVDPNAKIAQGYPANVMPQNFKETISKKKSKSWSNT